MIQVFTLGKPNPQIKNVAKDIFQLEKGAYNLPDQNHPQKELFALFYQLGIRQIIHDGKADEIVCLNGYLYPQKVAGLPIDEEEFLRIKASKES